MRIARKLTSGELDAVAGGVTIEPTAPPIGPIDPGSLPIDPNNPLKDTWTRAWPRQEQPMTEIDKKRVDDAKKSPDRRLSDAELSAIAAAGGRKASTGSSWSKPPSKP